MTTGNFSQALEKAGMGKNSFSGGQGESYSSSVLAKAKSVPNS